MVVMDCRRRLAAPPTVMVHGEHRIRPHEQSDCMGAHSKGYCVRPRCLRLLPSTSEARHVSSQVREARTERFVRFCTAATWTQPMHMCSPPMSLSPRQVYLPCSSASRDVWPTWTGMWPRVSSAYPSRSRVAAWPHRRVRGTPDLRHHKVRPPRKVKPYGVTSFYELEVISTAGGA